MKKIYLLLALTVGLVSSCDMDTTPYGTIPEDEALMTPDDFTSMRNGLYAGLRSSVGGNTFYTPIEAQSDEFHALVGNSNTYGDMYRWDFTPQNSYVGTVYGNYQAVIARANFIIQGYNSCDFSDTNTFNEEGMATARAAKGDAFFARAYSLFMLSQYFCADYEDILDFPGLEMRLCNIEGVDEPCTCAVDVEGRTSRPDTSLDDTSQTRSDVFVHDIRADDEIDVLRGHSRIVKGLFRGAYCEVFQFLVGYDVPVLNASPRINPSIACVQKFGQHVVGNNLLWKCTSCSNYFHCISL